MTLHMPIMVTQNFDVPNGIVNGSLGYLREINYFISATGYRILTSCVVEIPDATNTLFPGLPGKHFPLLPDSTEVIFTHPITGKRCTIHRMQIGIAPAFAMTCHKAQGTSLENVIVDVNHCRGSEAPYVMISRARSLEGLRMLRPFPIRKIQCRPSQDLREEFNRLAALTQKTKEQWKAAKDETIVMRKRKEHDTSGIQPRLSKKPNSRICPLTAIA